MPSSLRSTLRAIYRSFVPEALRDRLARYRGPQSKACRRVLRYYRFRPGRAQLYSSELAFLRRWGFSYFPYDFSRENLRDEALISDGNDGNLPFVQHETNRLYFPSGMDAKKIGAYYRQVVLEQHEQSPHRYLVEGFDLPSSGTVIDVGAAEGIFGVQALGSAKRIVLLEPESYWIPALRQTFAASSCEVHIVDKFAGNRTDGSTVSIDDFLEGAPVDFIKIDAEGAELSILEGARDSLKRYRPKLAVCCYHRAGDCERIVEWLKLQGYTCSFSEGFILYYHDPEWKPPFFRKALIRAFAET